MISAATGAMALLMVTLVKDHGLQYLLAATLLTGVLQILAGALRLGVLMRFVSRSVVTGFVNALAILIFLAQLPELTNPPRFPDSGRAVQPGNPADHFPVRGHPDGRGPARINDDRFHR
ncbi:hypothetical protein G6F22_019832 [Rhizopus arrhizus]|nr:hypothetical protein G6F22_019832 [Rhizopus arrhizus]